MTKDTIAVALLLFSGSVMSQYVPANIKFDTSLDCTSCIRGGYNFCYEIGAGPNGTVTSWDCDNKDREPDNWYINKTSSGGVAGGWVCSHKFLDQMNAIVSGCRPQFNQNRGDDCGSYFVDLTQHAEFTVGRSIENFPVNSSCTYRALSTCGYPSAAWRVNKPDIAGDFDIAFAAMDDLTPTNELDGWEPKQVTDWKGNYASSLSREYT